MRQQSERQFCSTVVDALAEVVAEPKASRPTAGADA